MDIEKAYEAWKNTNIENTETNELGNGCHEMEKRIEGFCCDVVKIEITNLEDTVFHGGDTVKGKVIIANDKPVEIDEVSVDFIGEAVFTFSDESNPETPSLCGSKEYFNENLELWKRENCIPQGDLEAGNYQYPFEFQLPENLPSSFEDEFGKVQYCVTCNLEKSGFADLTKTLFFPVGCKVDLNEIPKSLLSASCKSNRISGKSPIPLSCIMGTVSSNLLVKRGCYVPGEVIAITAEIINRARQKLTCSSLSLCQKVTYIGKEKSAHHIKTLKEIPLCDTKPGDSNSWHEMIPLEQLTPSQSLEENIIHIQYFIKLFAKGKSVVVENTSDIIIGTVPLHHE